jgi:transcriptional regulator with XRE-family HTH domain
MQETDFLRKKVEELLRKFRAKSGLSQSEVAERIGLPKKSGHSYVSRLESGKAKSLPLLRILSYLRVCGASWVEFFKELDRIDFKMRHERMMAKVIPPPEKRKIQRDAMRYEIGVESPSK